MSMYQHAAPLYMQNLSAQLAWLDKATADCAARHIDQRTLLRDRLAPDMLPLWRQFFIAADHAKNGISRLAGVEAPKFADDEPESFDAVKERIIGARAVVEAADRAAVDGSADRIVSVPIGGGKTMEMSGQKYLTLYSIPNFLFHATTAYGILRHNGVPLGKRDFLGA